MKLEGEMSENNRGGGLFALSQDPEVEDPFEGFRALVLYVRGQLVAQRIGGQRQLGVERDCRSSGMKSGGE